MPVDNTALMRLLRNSNIPMRLPSWSNPTFWSRPLIETKMLPIEASSSWQDIVSVAGLNNYSGAITGFTATPLGDASLSQVSFRFVYQGKLLSQISLGAPTFENNRQNALLFPTFPQSLYMIVERPDTILKIQALNSGVFQQTVLCAFFGYYYDNSNQAEKNDLEGLTDV